MYNIASVVHDDYTQTEHFDTIHSHHAHICIFMFLCIFITMHIHFYAYSFLCIFIIMHVHFYAYSFLCIFITIHNYIFISMHFHCNTYSNLYIFISMHIHTLTSLCLYKLLPKPFKRTDRHRQIHTAIQLHRYVYRRLYVTTVCLVASTINSMIFESFALRLRYNSYRQAVLYEAIL